MAITTRAQSGQDYKPISALQLLANRSHQSPDPRSGTELRPPRPLVNGLSDIRSRYQGFSTRCSQGDLRDIRSRLQPLSPGLEFQFWEVPGANRVLQVADERQDCLGQQRARGLRPTVYRTRS